MTITLHLPPDVEAALITEAQAKGVSLEELVSQRLISSHRRGTTVFEQGLGLFSSPEDAALLDEVVATHTRRDVARPKRACNRCESHSGYRYSVGVSQRI